ncbi:MAG: hypothetical protein D3904_03315, partial [Candidatus Electrothrix sp. EH2]|nr:hypothetical protein [Candidatus Electrothrix sp. EH2]
TFSAIVFMGTSISLAYHSANESSGSIMKDLPAQETAAPAQKEAPVTIPMPAMPETKSQPVDQVEEAAPETSSEEAVQAAEDVVPDEATTAPEAEEREAAETAETDSTITSFLEEETTAPEQEESTGQAE